MTRGNGLIPMGKWRRAKNAGLRGLVIRIHGTDCAICGEPCLYGVQHQDHPDYLTLDHIEPQALGGDHHLSNLRPAHRRCNELLGRLTREQVEGGDYEWIA